MSEPLTLGAGSGRGREKNGITAALKSYAKYDPAKTIGSVSINMRFNPTLFDSEKKLKRFQDMLSAYFFEYGGTHLITTVINAETRNGCPNILQAKAVAHLKMKVKNCVKQAVYSG